MKKVLKIWFYVFAAHLLINITYWMLLTSSLRGVFDLKDDYMIILSPLMIGCAAGNCGTLGLLTTIILSGLVISFILTMPLIFLFTKKKSNI